MLTRAVDYIKFFVHDRVNHKKSKGFSFIFAAVILTFLIQLAILMPFFALKVHIERVVIMETKYSNAQLTLLSLLSLTHTDPLDNNIKPIYKIISEHMSLTVKPDVTFLSSLLNDLVESRTYKLYYQESGGDVILAQSGSPSLATSSTSIILPYNSNQLSKELYLVID
jgi:hypothetical protein